MWLSGNSSPVSRVRRSNNILSIVSRRWLLNPAEVPQTTSAVLDNVWGMLVEEDPSFSCHSMSSSRLGHSTSSFTNLLEKQCKRNKSRTQNNERGVKRQGFGLRRENGKLKWKVQIVFWSWKGIQLYQTQNLKIFFFLCLVQHTENSNAGSSFYPEIQIHRTFT